MLAQAPPPVSDTVQTGLAETPLPPPPARRWGLAALGVGQWPLLLVPTLAIAYLFRRWQVTSALFLGPLAAGLAFAFSGSSLKVSKKVTVGSQAVIGCMVARSVDLSIVHFVAVHWPAILGVIVITAAASIVVALGL